MIFDFIHLLIIDTYHSFVDNMKLTVVHSLLATIASAAVFSSTTFNGISISGGTAGNAKAEALNALAGLPTDLTKVEQADIDVCDLGPHPSPCISIWDECLRIRRPIFQREMSRGLIPPLVQYEC